MSITLYKVKWQWALKWENKSAAAKCCNRYKCTHAVLINTICDKCLPSKFFDLNQIKHQENNIASLNDAIRNEHDNPTLFESED